MLLSMADPFLHNIWLSWTLMYQFLLSQHLRSVDDKHNVKLIPRNNLGQCCVYKMCAIITADLLWNAHLGLISLSSALVTA